MSGIRGKNTGPEMLVRRFLFSRAFRYRLHAKALPGKPDLILPKYRAAIFVHGCFWHGHSGCRLFKIPKTGTEFWEAKISRNIDNDLKSIKLLQMANWRCAIVWECGLRKKDYAETVLLPLLADWIVDGNSGIELT